MHYYKDKGIENFKRCLTDKELERFWRVIREHGREPLQDEVFFRLQYVLAGRIGEIVSLQVQDFDLENGRVWITRLKNCGKTQHRHVMPVPQSLLELVRQYVLAYRFVIERSGGFLFPSRTRPFERCAKTYKFNFRFREYARLAGLDYCFTTRKSDGAKLPMVRPHTLRATSINRMLKATGGDVFVAMQHSHHKSLEGFLPYVEAFKAEELEEVQRKVFSEKEQKKREVFQ